MLDKETLLTPFEGKRPYTITSSVKTDDFFLHVSYEVLGRIKNIEFIKYQSFNTREWDLWDESCFELFLKLKDEKQYIEFNFSSKNSWNCFYLTDFRENTGEYNKVRTVKIDTETTPKSFILTAKIPLEQIDIFNQDDYDNSKMSLGITAVILDREQKKSHFAAIHQSGSPDFHNFDTFI